VSFRDFRFYIEVLRDATVLASDSRFKNLGLALPVTRREQNCSGDNLPECLSLGWRYPIQIMALHHPQRGALPELRSRPEMRIVHCREGVPHCILSPAPQVERLFRLALRVSLPPDVERFGASYLPNKFTGSRGNYNVITKSSVFYRLKIAAEKGSVRGWDADSNSTRNTANLGAFAGLRVASGESHQPVQRAEPVD